MGRKALAHGQLGPVTYRTLGTGTVQARARLGIEGIVPSPTVAGSGRTRAEAARALEEARAERMRAFRGLGASTETLRETAAIHMEAAERRIGLLEAAERRIGLPGGSTRSTWSQYRDHLKRLVLPSLGGRRTSGLTVPVLDNLLERIAAENGASSARITRAALSGVFKDAVRRGVVQPPNPVLSTRPPVVPEPEEVRIATPEQVAALRTALLDHIRAVSAGRRAHALQVLVGWDVMTATGVRISEALSLRWEDCELDGSVPRALFRAHVVERRGKPRPGDGSSSLSVEPGAKGRSGKRAHGRRFVLTQTAVEGLLELRSVMGGSEWVFETRNGTPASPSNYRHRLGRALDAAGLAEEGRVTPHAARRTVATIIEQAEEGGLDAASAYLDHSSISITARHYVAGRVHDARDFSEALDAYTREAMRLGSKAE